MPIKWQVIIPISLALTFLVFTSFFFPFRGKIQFDGDEGINLMRSMLVVMGKPLYTEISSDQPPLFTHLLALLLRVTGFEVSPARMLVILFASLLVWACSQMLMITHGWRASMLFLPLIIMAPRFLVLSVSVMIGLPAISLAAVALLGLLLWQRDQRQIWLVLSGLAMALSLLIKLFTVFMAPLILAGILLTIYLRERRFTWPLLRPALAWSISFGGLGLVLGLALVGPQNIPQIILPHLLAPAQAGFRGANFAINTHLQPALPLLLLGAFGALLALLRRQWLALYPLGWAVLAYILLLWHAPVFYHHQLLITVPAAMLAAIGIDQGLGMLVSAIGRWSLPRPFARLASGLLTVLLLGVLINSAIPTLQSELVDSTQTDSFALRGTAGKLKVLNLMADYADRTRWILTDMPMYAFLVRRLVPPLLATFSEKRLLTDSITAEEVLATLRAYNPEQVMLARFNLPLLDEYLALNYSLVASPEFFRLYIRKDLLILAQ